MGSGEGAAEKDRSEGPSMRDGAHGKCGAHGNYVRKGHTCGGKEVNVGVPWTAQTKSVLLRLIYDCVCVVLRPFLWTPPFLTSLHTFPFFLVISPFFLFIFITLLIHVIPLTVNQPYFILLVNLVFQGCFSFLKDGTTKFI